jgi:hypothetical protein
VLERLGWQFVRIRGSQFFRDQQAVIEDAVNQLAALGTVPEMTAEINAIERDELSARVIRRAEQLRTEWSGRGQDPIVVVPLEEQEPESPWQLPTQLDVAV